MSYVLPNHALSLNPTGVGDHPVVTGYIYMEYMFPCQKLVVIGGQLHILGDLKL